jgi:hypothetical protein
MLDSEVLALAAAQFGVVERRQLIERGHSRWSIDRARDRGLFAPVTTRVLRITSAPDTFLSRCMAAQLHTRRIGFLAGPTAGRLYGLRKMPTRPIHVAIPESHRISVPPWIQVAHASWFDADRDMTTLADSALLVATPMRMLFGLADAFNQFRFERAAEDAWHRRLITPVEAAEYLAVHRCRGKNGVSTIERWLERTQARSEPAQSGLEQALLRAIDELVDVPPPVRQYPLRLRSGETIRLDVAWPLVRLAVEPGAAWWHGGDLGQRRDQARDRACGELGWMVVRYDESFLEDPSGNARELRSIYRARLRPG